MSRKKIPLRDRFFSFAIIPDDPEQCWSWCGSKNEHGYGRLQEGTTPPRVIKAHRASWLIHETPIPDGLDVLHKCDNPECTNPKHLFLGTHADNMGDASRKGRWEGKGRGVSRNAGELSPQARLSDATIAEIRALAEAGARQKDVAAFYGVAKSYVSQLVSGTRRKTPLS